jgi:tetratricopeptide (TPR) repeat protein
MGARRTLVAKIWLGEMHVLWPNYGHHWIGHELAHVFTEPFGAGPLDLSMQNGVGVNMGMVEEIATAADWPVRDLTPHEAAAAMQRLEMAPRIRDIVGASGFWTRSSRRAYTVVGSFIRYLIDEYGIETFKRAYGRGAFQRAYGTRVDELVAEWRAFLDELELTDRALETARYRYRRPSIFEKVCARTTAELRRRAGIAAARGDVGEMQSLYRRLTKLVSDNVDYRIEYARRLLRAGDRERSAELVEELLERDLPPVQRARLLQLQGDLRWHGDSPEDAAEAYAACLEEGVPTDQRRVLRAKYLSVQPGRGDVRSLAFEYLLGDPADALSLYFPMEWARRRPEDPLANYLVGRRLWQRREWEGAVRYLRAARGRVEGRALRAETKRMLGRSFYFREEFASAARVFERLRRSGLSHYREEAEEWLRRIDWRRARTSGTE